MAINPNQLRQLLSLLLLLLLLLVRLSLFTRGGCCAGLWRRPRWLLKRLLLLIL
jgi:hypothetical protein